MIGLIMSMLLLFSSMQQPVYVMKPVWTQAHVESICPNSSVYVFSRCNPEPNHSTPCIFNHIQTCDDMVACVEITCAPIRGERE